MSADVILSFAALPMLGMCCYLALLAATSRRSRRPLHLYRPSLKLAVVIPAHNEEAGIADTVRALGGQDYPLDLWDVTVVADNCSDETAVRAVEAGAAVLIRQDATRRGKGYALAFAFEHLAEQGFDALVVLDADTRASPNLLSALATRLETGAQAAQADYGVANADDSWRTRLMHIALALFHGTRSLAREHLGLSCGLRGNGMAFHRTVLAHHPYRAFSLAEDLEYGLELGRAGVRVAYVPEATVWGEMPAGERASRSQRRRWEQGRSDLRRRYGLPLLRDLLRHPSALELDLLADLLIPPLSTVAATVTLGLAASVCLRASTAIDLWVSACVLLTVYVVRGWQLSNTGWRGVLDLSRAPAYLLWKLALPFHPASGARHEWVRTTRRSEARS